MTDVLLLSASAVAKALSVTSRTIHNWRRRGLIRAVALPAGRGWRIPLAEVERIAAAGGQDAIDPIPVVDLTRDQAERHRRIEAAFAVAPSHVMPRVTGRVTGVERRDRGPK